MNRFSDDLLVALRSYVIEVKPILFKSKPGLTGSYVHKSLQFRKTLSREFREQISLK